MQFEGAHTFAAPAHKLWKLLDDPEVLQRITPGVEQLVATGPDTYRAVLQVKMGPINSSFDGTLQVADRVEPRSYRLLVDVDGRIGHIEAEAHIALEAQGEATLLRVRSGSQLSGRLASMGQRLLAGVARMFTRQFFEALEKELES